jgi:hypothetical protein
MKSGAATLDYPYGQISRQPIVERPYDLLIRNAWRPFGNTDYLARRMDATVRAAREYCLDLGRSKPRNCMLEFGLDSPPRSLPL